METRKKHHYFRGPSLKANKSERKEMVAEPSEGVDFYTNAPSDDWTPALRLRFAVIEEAVALLKKGPVNHYSTGHERDYRDTVAWVDGRVESAPTFSLAEIASALDLDHKKLRSYMKNLVEGHRSKWLAETRVAC